MRKLLLLITALLFLSCEEGKTHYNIEQIPLRQLVKNSENVSRFSGGYFLIGGTVSGTTSKENYIEVFGNYQGMYRYFKIPLERVRIKIDEEVKTPYIKITYFWNAQKTLEGALKYQEMHDVNYIIVCPEKYLPEQLLPMDF